MIYVLSGGGNNLNFEVVGGTSAPASPKENTIWVNTSTTITSWVFSATQPTGSSGMVWFTTGTSSIVAFNALKKNSIMVYALSAKQYVSGAWKDVNAKSYLNGEWVAWWSGELFINGNQYEAFTGGWKKANYNWNSNDTPDVGTLTIENTIYLSSSVGAYCKGVRISNKVDLTGWKTLKYITTQYNKGEASVVISATESYDLNDASAKGSFVVGENSLDITELTGEYYIGAYVRNAGSVTIEKIYLEQ